MSSQNYQYCPACERKVPVVEVGPGKVACGRCGRVFRKKVKK